MRNYGAATPHGAFTYNVESSNGAKYRDKIYCENYIDIACNNGNDYNNTSDTSLENKCRYSPLIATTSAAKKSAKTSTTTKMMRLIQSSGFHFSFLLCLIFFLCLLPNQASCDESDTFFVNGLSPGLEPTTPEFDYASRGKKKFGDKCDSTLECGFPGSTCDEKKKLCQCTEDLPVTNHLDKCGKKANINESCFFNEQCESMHFQTECHDGRCICRFEMTPVVDKDGNFDCIGNNKKREPETYIDPAMIGVLVGMALMFVIICVVLRLFSQARWRENRTIFNTPNPRLMNVSLLRDSKLLHGQERRGSRMSVRAPSRQPSMASLRPHSPNPSLGNERRMTRSKSNTKSSDSKSSELSNTKLIDNNPSTSGATTASNHVKTNKF